MTSGGDIKPSQAPFSIYHFRCVALMQQIMAVKCREILPCFPSQLNTHSPRCSDCSLHKNRCALAGGGKAGHLHASSSGGKSKSTGERWEGDETHVGGGDRLTRESKGLLFHVIE